MLYYERMIAQLKGTVASKGRGFVVVDVGGVGYKVFVTLATLTESKVDSNITMRTYLAVRDNALDLFGFLTEEERAFFELLISISGIGPKSALGILNIADVATITTAVRAGDSSYLTRVSGIGKKNAEKIVLELTDKLDKGAEDETDTDLKGDMEALEALIALGYSAGASREALKAVPKEAKTPSERIKAALKALGTTKG